ncbi:MAG: hypothetical protein R2780_07415 [Crocinitomicaceae bacterium]
MSSYKFRVLIDNEDNEEIFRDIIISSNENFEAFYEAIVSAFNFSGQELASFYVSNDEWDKGHEVALMDMELNESLNAPSIMKETIIKDLVTTKDQKFIMVYDFLRMWCFLIELVETINETYEYPEVSLSVGKAPEEDSKEIDFENSFDSEPQMDLGNDLDDIFSDDNDEDEEDYSDYGDFDDYDY